MLQTYGRPFQNSSPAGPDHRQTAASPHVCLLSSTFSANPDQADYSLSSRVPAQLHPFWQSLFRQPAALPHVCLPSSTFLAKRAPVCTRPSTIPATVKTPPMMAHVVVMKWYLPGTSPRQGPLCYICVWQPVARGHRAYMDLSAARARGTVLCTVCSLVNSAICISA